MTGQFKFTEEARKLLDHFHMSGGKPRPDHPKLFHYNSRRTSHVLKLSMVVSVSEGDTMTITDTQVRRAMDLLTEAERFMPDIFKSMANTSHAQLIEETWHFIHQAWIKSGKKVVAESRVVNFLSLRTPAHNVNRVLEVMVNGGLTKKELSATAVGYVPIQPQRP